MIVEDEKKEAANTIGLNLNETPSTSVVREAEITHEEMPEFAKVLEKHSKIRDHPTHMQLKKDLVEHIWQKFGPN